MRVRGRRIRQVPVVAAVTIVVLSVVDLGLLWALVGSHYDADRFGTLAEWTTGAVTAGAVVIAFYAISADRTERRHEVVRERYAQAAQVVVTCTKTKDTYQGKR